MSLARTTDDQFDADVLAAALPTLVEFTAAWCPPCRVIEPVLTQIAEDESARLSVLAMDADANPRTAQRYGVLGLPTLMLVVDGEVVAQIVGARPRAAIMRELEPHLAAAAG